MEEKSFMEMYAKMFGNFQEQLRIYMVMVAERVNGKEGASLEILDSYKENLTNTLNVLESSIENCKENEFKNFYKTKIEYSYKNIDELANVISPLSATRK